MVLAVLGAVFSCLAPKPVQMPDHLAMPLIFQVLCSQNLREIPLSIPSKTPAQELGPSCFVCLWTLKATVPPHGPCQPRCTSLRVLARKSPGAVAHPFEAAGVLLPHDPDFAARALGQGEVFLCLFHRCEFCHDVVGHGSDFGGFTRLVDVEGQCLTRGGEPAVFVP